MSTYKNTTVNFLGFYIMKVFYVVKTKKIEKKNIGKSYTDIAVIIVVIIIIIIVKHVDYIILYCRDACIPTYRTYNIYWRRTRAVHTQIIINKPKKTCTQNVFVKSFLSSSSLVYRYIIRVMCIRPKVEFAHNTGGGGGGNIRVIFTSKSDSRGSYTHRAYS